MSVDYTYCNQLYGPIKILCDAMLNAEMQGAVANITKYIKDAIVFTQASENVYLFTVFIPQFSYYFKFEVKYNKDTFRYEVTDFALFQPDFPPKTEVNIDAEAVRDMIRAELEPIIVEIRKQTQKQHNVHRETEELAELLSSAEGEDNG